MTVVSPARSLKAMLRRELAPPKDGVRLLLRPESATERRYLDELQTRGTKLPPCRIVWIGDLHDWDQRLHVAALVERPISEGTLVATLLPLGLLWSASIGRMLSERWIDREPSGGYTKCRANPQIRRGPLADRPVVWLSRHGHRNGSRVPALAIANLAGRPRFASSPLCVVADRAAKRLVVIPSWEIFRYYYAQSDRLRVEHVWLSRLGPHDGQRLLARRVRWAWVCRSTPLVSAGTWTRLFGCQRAVALR